MSGKRLKDRKVQVIAGRNYRTEVYVNDEFCYETSAHRQTEIQHLTRLFDLLDFRDVKVTDEEEFVKKHG